jgi:hypothetical protein
MHTVAIRSVRWSLGLIVPVLCAGSWAGGAEAPAPLKLTAQQDHRNMMEQLGITSAAAGGRGHERQGAQLRQLRRGQGQSLSESAGPVDAQERTEGHDRRDVVEPAPAGDRRGLRP